MEDVLDVYCRPYDEHEPLVCLDEMGKNLVKEKHPCEPAKAGQDRREDYTYEKKGQRNLLKPKLVGSLQNVAQAFDQWQNSNVFRMSQ